MIRRLALSAGFAILGAVAFAPNAQAQTGTASETVPFTGTVGSACTFSNTQPGTLEAPGTAPRFIAGNVGIFSAGNGTAGKTTVNCSNGGSLTVAQPNPISVPAGFNPAVTQAIIATETDVSPYTSSPGPRFDTGSYSQVQPSLTIPTGTDVELQVGMIAGERNGPVIPSGFYEYEVTLTAAPN
ncbi:MAG: hypothetical protein KI793_31115 [Rivularia sp. (in: Bacteria)]|nr:hypothetical protein [Rivularia sp. MS3]